MKKNTLVTCLALSISTLSFSQQGMRENWCGSIEAMEANFIKHPELKQQFDLYQAAANIQQNQTQLRPAAANYTIPVVFHVLHQYGTENISDAPVSYTHLTGITSLTEVTFCSASPK